MDHTTHQQQSKGFSLNRSTLLLCLGVLSLAIVAVAVFKVPFGTVALFGLVLACPLMHVWMMKDGGHKH